MTDESNASSDWITAAETAAVIEIALAFLAFADAPAAPADQALGDGALGSNGRADDPSPSFAADFGGAVGGFTGEGIDGDDIFGDMFPPAPLQQKRPLRWNRAACHRPHRPMTRSLSTPHWSHPALMTLSTSGQRSLPFRRHP